MDTGEVEYRRAEPPTVEFGSRIDAARGWAPGSECREVNPTQAPRQRGEPRDLGGGYRRWACIPLFPGRLIRRNASIGEPIEPNQFYSVRIDHAVIAELIETPISFRRLLSGRDPTRRVGEIAILANTFEYSSADVAAGAPTNDFFNLSNLSGVKVVYYNPDVEQGQALNLSNIPLTEGRRYSGRPVGIQIVVLELDRMSGPMQNLMRTLAALGQQSSALPGGPAAQALLDLGTSLISQENDDVMFEYRFVLDRSDSTDHVSSAPFEAGRYVVRRTHERRRMPRWDDLMLDHNTGQLMRRQGDAQPRSELQANNALYLPFEEDTYFTLNVLRHEEDGAFAYRPQTLADLNKEIESAAEARDAPLNAVTDRLRGVVVAGRNRQLAQELIDAWRVAATRYRNYARHYADPAIFAAPGATCAASPHTDPDRERIREEALFEARTAASQFISLYDQAMARQATEDRAASSNGNNGQTASPELFTDEVQRAVLASLGAFFAPFPSGVAVTPAFLTNPPEFRSAFLGAKASDFLTAAEKAAQLIWSPRTCDRLKAARLAVDAPPAQSGQNPET